MVWIFRQSSVAQTPVQHVPGKHEPDECDRGESDHSVAEFGPQPVALLSPRAESVICRNHRSKNSQPAYDLNNPQQWIEPRTQHANVLLCQDEKYCEAAQEKKIE